MKVFGSRLLILYFLSRCNCSSESRREGRIQTVRQCFLHALKELIVDVMSSRVDREWQRRRRFHSEDALGSLRLKNSRAWYLSRITKLYREIKELSNDVKNVNEASEKLLDNDEAFTRFVKHVILKNIATEK